MKNKMKLLTAIILSQTFSSISLEAAALLEPLETATPLGSNIHKTIQKDLEDRATHESTVALEKSDSYASNNIKHGLLYGVKVLSGIGSSMIYEKYLSHYKIPGRIFTNVPHFGAALFGYMLPDLLNSATDFSQKPNANSGSFGETLKLSLKNTGAYMGTYMMSLSVDEAFAQIAYHGTLYLTADPLLANASYQGARNLTYYTSATPTLIKAAKEAGSTFLSNAVNGMKKWWSGTRV